jgi:hypothetical protein
MKIILIKSLELSTSLINKINIFFLILIELENDLLTS